ncbi:MAG: Nif3-like dinuclear metal center hexameric protein [Syntrophomonas sp.]
MNAIVKDIIRIMENDFPPYLAEDWDNSGLQVGSYNTSVNKIMISLDLDQQILQQAIDSKVDMIITHHPLLFKPVKSINIDQPPGNIIMQLIKNDICVYAAHTNLDASEKGLNQLLAETLNLKNIGPLDKSRQESYYKLVVFVPVTHINEVSKAISDAGAGYIGNYSDCNFRTGGIGTFRPQKGTRPFIGTEGNLTEIDEFRLETIVPKHLINRVVRSMIEAHPYEEVAYDLYCLANEGQIISLGRRGKLDNPITLNEFAADVKKRLQVDNVQVAGDLDKVISNVAVVSGAGASFLKMITAQDIDVLVTGDVKYHEAKDAIMSGLAVVDAGHQGTEEIMVNYLVDLLERQCKELNYNIEFSKGHAEKCLKTI